MAISANGPEPVMFLGIAGGHLETQCVLVGPDGTVLASRSTRTASPQHVGFEESARVIGELADATFAAAGLSPAVEVRRVVVFIAGADTAADRRQLQQRLAGRFPGSDLDVDNDIHGILWAGLRRPSGVAVLADDGMNAIARSATGKTAGYLAFGVVSGEWGGRIGLGREVLYAASRAEDLRGPETTLRYYVAAHLGRSTVREALIACRAEGTLDAELPGLADLVFAADDEGDRVARELVDRLADEIVTMAKAAMERARVNPAGSDAILAGSLLTRGHRRLDQRVDEQFHLLLPGISIARTSVPPVVGAALAGLGAERGGPALGDRLMKTIIAGIEARAREHPTGPVSLQEGVQ
ncbi:N-acetylglucosamine kinase [Jiangella gansuensis]|uniref:N-acetylglucosamine kinase n=1 Tax=Jiangella gansuensis TaxID=281473 RepID=UPI00047A2C79|nr:BadF/BadG/BcrA/BcrD ATPase family protein [Jiangella gansuensis]